MPEGLIMRDYQAVQMVDTTDARAAGLVTSRVNATLVELPEGVVMTTAGAEWLTNDGGA
jgi:hypothetical protein